MCTSVVFAPPHALTRGILQVAVGSCLASSSPISSTYVNYTMLTWQAASGPNLSARPGNSHVAAIVGGVVGGGGGLVLLCLLACVCCTTCGAERARRCCGRFGRGRHADSPGKAAAGLPPPALAAT